MVTEEVTNCVVSCSEAVCLTGWVHEGSVTILWLFILIALWVLTQPFLLNLLTLIPYQATLFVQCLVNSLIRFPATPFVHYLINSLIPGPATPFVLCLVNSLIPCLAALFCLLLILWFLAQPLHFPFVFLTLWFLAQPLLFPFVFLTLWLLAQPLHLPFVFLTLWCLAQPLHFPFVFLTLWFLVQRLHLPFVFLTLWFLAQPLHLPFVFLTLCFLIQALSPSVAECLRAVFAAFMWHEGIVHDAMACASFLKFHPDLTKAMSQFVKGKKQERVRQRHATDSSKDKRDSRERRSLGQGNLNETRVRFNLEPQVGFLAVELQSMWGFFFWFF